MNVQKRIFFYSTQELYLLNFVFQQKIFLIILKPLTLQPNYADIGSPKRFFVLWKILLLNNLSEYVVLCNYISIFVFFYLLLRVLAVLL